MFFFIYLVEDHYNDIINYSPRCIENYYADICDGSYYQSQSTDGKFVSLVWHIDGAPTINSKTLEIWLILAFVIELPVSARFCLRNVLLCGIWFVDQKPDFDLFQLHFVREIKHLKNNGFNINHNGNIVPFSLKIFSSLADLPARAASLKLKQFNGKFGCPVCYHPGRQHDDNHLIRLYRHRAKKFPLRTATESIAYADLAEETGSAVMGWKGRSVVLDIIEIPNQTPFDYMHLVLEGELKRKLVCFFFPPNGILSKPDLNAVNKILRKIKFPHDFSKKVSSISEKLIRRAKAGEMQVLLLHVLLPAVKSFIPNHIFCHLGLLVTALQLLNNDVATDEDIIVAEEMLDEYHRVDVELYGETSQTFTNHALIHFADQRRKHGCPLLLLSNSIFEGFIASLKRQ